MLPRLCVKKKKDWLFFRMMKQGRKVFVAETIFLYPKE